MLIGWQNRRLAKKVLTWNRPAEPWVGRDLFRMTRPRCAASIAAAHSAMMLYDVMTSKPEGTKADLSFDEQPNARATCEERKKKIVAGALLHSCTLHHVR